MPKSDIRTMKIKYDLTYGDPDLFEEYLRQYNSCLRTFYNALVDNPEMKYKDAGGLVEDYYPEKHLIDSYLLNASFQEAQSLYKRHNITRVESGKEALGHKFIFGGRKQLERRSKGLISKEEFRESRLVPLCVIGEANKSGNGRFKIRDFKHVDFVIKGKTVFTFKLHDKRLRILDDLKKLQDNKEISITYKVTKNNICISFDKKKVRREFPKLKAERHLSMDLNPAFIGITVFDDIDGQQNLKTAVVLDLSEILKRHEDSKSASDSEISNYYNNKRKFELKELNQRIFNLAKHYGAQYIDVENLHFKHATGRKCTTQWNKTLTVDSLEGKCIRSGIELLKINPAYTSIIGNIIHDYNMPDMCRAALEVGNRSLLGMYYNTFNAAGIDFKAHLTHFNEVKSFVIKSMEERDNEELISIDDFKGISKFLYSRKIKFRKSIDDCKQFETSCNFKSSKSLVRVLSYKPLKGGISDQP